MQGDRVARVDQAEIGVKKSYFGLLAFEGEGHGFLAQQAVDGVEVAFHIAQFHRAESHGAAAGEAGADAEIDPAGGEFVQRGEGAGGDGGDAVGGNENAGAETDARGFYRRRAHGNEAIGAEHLRVVEPSMREAEFFRALDGFPTV